MPSQIRVGKSQELKDVLQESIVSLDYALAPTLRLGYTYLYASNELHSARGLEIGLEVYNST